MPRPEKELKAFVKLALAPGETATVRRALDMRALAWFDEAAAAWRADAGRFEVLDVDHVEVSLLEQLLLGIAEQPAHRRVGAQEAPPDREHGDRGRRLLEQRAEQRVAGGG